MGPLTYISWSRGQDWLGGLTSSIRPLLIDSPTLLLVVHRKFDSTTWSTTNPSQVSFVALAKIIVSSVKELMLWYAASEVHKEVKMRTNVYLRSAVDYLESHPATAKNNLAHTCSCPNFFW